MPRLPAGYTELKYIQSSGAQYIDTQIKPATSMKLVMDVEPLAAVSSTDTDKYFFDSHYFPFPSIGSKYVFRTTWTSSGVQASMGAMSSVTHKTVSSNTTLRRMTLQMDAVTKSAAVDDKSVTFTSNAITSSMSNILLLTYDTSTTYMPSAKLYSCQIYNGDEPVRDFVPCINPSGIAGLYDAVNGVFYQSGTATAFEAGPKVSPYITVTTEPPDAGTIAVTWSDDKTSVTVSQTAAEGYRFTGYYSESDELLSADSEYTFEPTEDTEITAKYAEIPRYIISASASPTAAGTASGGGDYSGGSELTVTASAPNHGYVFLGWQKDGVTVSADFSYTFTVTENVTLIAQYELDESLKKYRFSSWQENGGAVSTGQSYSFQATADRHLTAKFEFIPIYAVTVNVGEDQLEHGTVSGGGAYLEGESVTVVATPIGEYVFVAWQENGVTVSTNESYTFTVSADITFTALFKFQKLPEGYTEVEYIQSTAPASIDTGVKPTKTMKFVMDTEPTVAATSAKKYWAYSYYKTSGNTTYEFALSWASELGIIVSYGFTGSDSVPYEILTSSTKLQRRTITVDYKNKEAFVDEESKVTLSSNAVSANMPTIKLLRPNNGAYAIAAKIYSCQIWDDDTLVRDFVPCTNPSGTVGLFDLVGEAFYGNASTTGGSFTAGPAV